MIGLLLTGIFVLLIVSAALAPLESLGWWAGWYGEQEPLPAHGQEAARQDLVTPIASDAASHYLVYLSGIGAITDDSIPEEEIKWLDQLNQRIPQTLLITDVFPYSVTNAGLTGQRAFAWIWRRAEQARLKNPMAVGALLVNARNMLQVAVCADPRYGPIYSLGVAREIVRSLLAHGYTIESGQPVTLLGWSGGGQMALGAAHFVHSMIRAPLRIISIGGVMADDPGIESIVHLYHFYGSKDPVHGLGAKLYSGRWAVSQQSRWNRAVRAGKITMTCLGPLTHNGKNNYFDWSTTLPDGQSGAEVSLAAVTGVLAAEGLSKVPDGALPAADQTSQTQIIPSPREPGEAATAAD